MPELHLSPIADLDRGAPAEQGQLPWAWRDRELHPWSVWTLPAGTIAIVGVMADGIFRGQEPPNFF
jgi:hypothetical protein